MGCASSTDASTVFDPSSSTTSFTKGSSSASRKPRRVTWQMSPGSSQSTVSRNDLAVATDEHDDDHDTEVKYVVLLDTNSTPKSATVRNAIAYFRPDTSLDLFAPIVPSSAPSTPVDPARATTGRPSGGQSVRLPRVPSVKG